MKLCRLVPAFVLSSLACVAAAAEPARVQPGWIAAPSGGEALDLPGVDESLPRPDTVLGYPLGSRFTHWDRILDYLGKLAEDSPRVELWEYGRTSEGRPLVLLAVSSQENLARLEEIRQASLQLADPPRLDAAARDRLVRRNPVVVWLAFGIHGNESSSAEAAMGTAYALAGAQGDTAKQLEAAVVLIDPLENPDGRERYLSSFEQRRGLEPNPRRSAAEHFEPWPGGRFNHYMIDLNRDWAWASQPETRQRIAAYRKWEPQVFVDFHEMSSDSSYFFPPAADPIHPQIDRRIIAWLDTFGRANAETFDRHGWIYFKSESFDLFYPGYGDSYPSLRGAVGMTYEMAGGGRAGQAITLADGSTLTLADRVARHLTTALTTVKTAAANARKLQEDFAANRAKAAADPVRTYLWPGDAQEAATMADLLRLHGVEVKRLTKVVEIPVRSQAEPAGEPASRRFLPGTYAVTTAQPLGNLIEALLELGSPMSQGFVDRQRKRLENGQETEFYDVTAWSVPLAFGVPTWVAGGAVSGGEPVAGPPGGGLRGTGDLGVLVPPQGLATYRLAAELQKRGLRYRLALAPFTSPEASFAAGTLYIPYRDDRQATRESVEKLVGELGLTAHAVASSYNFRGLSLGSNDMAPVRAVRVGLLGGEGADPTSFGFLWYLLDQLVGVAHDRLDLAQLRQVDLADFDVLVLPQGEYEDRLGESTKEALDAWIKAGGALVAVGDAVRWLGDQELTSIKRWQPPKKEDDKSDDDPEGGETTVEKDLARRPIYTPGAVLATRLQAQHPLSVGLAAAPHVLVEGTLVLEATGDPRQDVLVALDEEPVVAGFAWPEAEERLAGSLLVGIETRGRGSVVVFAQDPAYRLFWRATTPILLNVLLHAPSLGAAARY